jgi:hypothetical protein
VARNHLSRGLEPHDPILVAAVLAIIFGSDVALGAISLSGVALGAFSASGKASGAFVVPACPILDPPPLEPLDPVTDIVFLAATFESGVGSSLLGVCLH